MAARRRGVAVVVIGALLAASCSGGGDEDGEEGLPTEPFALDLDVGACFDRPQSPDAGDVPELECNEPHDFELYASVELEGDGFPGEEEVVARALGACNERFAEYVGVPPDQSGLVVVPVAPTVEQWEDDERTVDCTVTVRGPDRLERSVEGSEQPAG